MSTEHRITQSRTEISPVQASTNRRRYALAFLAPAILGFAMQSPLAAQITSIALPLPVATTDEASILHKVKVVRSALAYACPATGLWVDVPGATATLVMPANHKDLFNARFFAESVFWGAAGYGSVRILLNNVEMNPAAGTDYAFDSNDGGNEGSTSWEGHALERSGSFSTSLLPLNAVVKVQCRAPANTNFRLDDWHFTVEQLH